ncbi:LysR family transcriptional regulator [Psychromonas algicola]|uniref:LysR family transcriptional regulator n=1 Tax=Psychromonas algicola TaxID=2555642 RepID=UPI001067EE23|nr:LysR family transcriptional regulator [Psychromonas sp. RZ5]TEW52840.1 LysR family transcriptional regulator [Psychromonas sp. RZ5]
MEFYHLRSFVVVAKTGNLTLAAKQLFTTPPAISAHIKALEEELQTSLFVRSSKGMQLTEKGRLLLPKAQNTLDSALSLVNEAADNQHEIIGTFKLAINQSAAQLKIPTLVANIQENIPGVSIDITSMATGKTLEAIRGNQIDGGYIYGDIPEDCFAIKVKMQKITTITNKEFQLTDKTIKQEDWITMGFYCPFDQFLKSKIGNNIKSVASSDDEISRLELVKSGLGLSFYEREEAEFYEDKGQIKLLSNLDFETPLYFVVANNKVNDPVIKALLQEIKILWEIKP